MQCKALSCAPAACPWTQSPQGFEGSGPYNVALALPPIYAAAKKTPFHTRVPTSSKWKNIATSSQKLSGDYSSQVNSMEKVLSFLPHPSNLPPPQSKSHIYRKFSRDDGGWPRNLLYLTYWWRPYLHCQQIYTFRICFLRLKTSFVSQYRDVMERDLKTWCSWGRYPEAALTLHVTEVHKLQVECYRWFGGSWLLVFLFWLFIVAVSASGDRIWRTEASQRQQRWLN